MTMTTGTRTLYIIFMKIFTWSYVRWWCMVGPDRSLSLVIVSVCVGRVVGVEDISRGFRSVFSRICLWSWSSSSSSSFFILRVLPCKWCTGGGGGGGGGGRSKSFIVCDELLRGVISMACAMFFSDAMELDSGDGGCDSDGIGRWWWWCGNGDATCINLRSIYIYR